MYVYISTLLIPGAPQAPFIFIGALCGALYLRGATINFYIQAGAGRRKLSQTAPRVWGLGRRCSPKKSIACSPPLLHRYALFSDLGESSDTIWVIRGTDTPSLTKPTTQLASNDGSEIASIRSASFSGISGGTHRAGVPNVPLM
jgi:hypothetical protein